MTAMKAVVKATAEAGSLRVVDLPIPEPAAGQVLVRVRSASICYTDVSVLDNKYVGKKPIPLPLVMGHEGAGEIAGLGAGVKGINVGERVALEPISGCGHCAMCRTGFQTMCADWVHIGLTCNGTFAEYVVVDAGKTHRISDKVSFAEAALLEPLALIVRSLEQSRPMVGDTVAIIGPGSLGLMHLLAYRAAGASKIFVAGLDKDQERFRIARQLGADGVINISNGDPVAALLAETGGLGADIVVETANAPKATELAFELAAARGRVVLFGLYPEANFSPVKMLRKGLTVYGDVGAVPRQFMTASRWIDSGKVDVKPLITRRFGLDDCSEAFATAHRGDNIKIIFEM
jgi:threonine dehydrogenase-like Zn-dependent dehydrogenase